MTVLFANKSVNQRYYRLDIGDRLINFVDGKFHTTDKEVISKIMTSEAFRKYKEIVLVTDERVVSDYLDGVQNSYIQKEDVANLSDEGLLKLAEGNDISSRAPGIIRVSVVGLPMNDYNSTIINKFQKLAKEKDLLDRALEAGVLEQKGAWYLTPNGETKLQGKRQAEIWIEDNKEILELEYEQA